jgi:hypothetical protein
MKSSNFKSLSIIFVCSLFAFIACNQDGKDGPIIDKKTKYQFLNYISLDEEFRIGESKSTDKYIFATILDIEVSSSGDVFVLDGGDYTIKVFDRNGNFKKSIGGKGSGPGEMQVPSGIALGPGGKLLLCDRALKRVTVFEENGDFSSTIKMADLPSFYRIAIGTPENFYLTGVRSEGVIHKLDMKGAVLNSFGKAYPDENRLIQDFFRHGALCIGRNDTVYYFPDGENEIRVFDNTGNLIKTITRSGEYTPIKYEKLASGSVRYTFQEGVRHFSFPVSLHVHPYGFLFSQIGHGESKVDHKKIVTEIHYLADKTSYVVSDSLSAIGDIDTKGNLYCFQNYPVPQVIKYSTIIHSSKPKFKPR